MLKFCRNKLRLLFGFILDGYLTMNEDVSTIASTCCLELSYLASICRFMRNTATVHLYLLFGSTDDVMYTVCNVY